MDAIAYDLPDPELVIEFDPPLSHGGMSCDSIRLREPTGAEVRAAEGHLRKGISAEAIRIYQMSLIRSVSGVPQQIIDAMPISKIMIASEYLQAFVTPNQATGNS
ncbi:phage tail assembly protein [Lichenicola cladoniae]|uniref:Phage tail assembly protein n=1 Tax=Lichenicola cladoniae TaxID=1484109 RepID=A0A6M8HND0_9PROT|nr:phage tail assembly protein [Lichenicola cladoniae]NPD67302.1 phage tail assembly protein [Acetobacteraceae bacterium]QKE89805.1 phage tail assembly protein [Lichenicola cladoniae]